MTTTEERRKKVFVGDLGTDFLRLGGPSVSVVSHQHQTVFVNTGRAAFVPPNTRGRLSITIVSARLAKNYGLVRMDPYARLRVGNTIFETPTDVSGGKAPKWNRTIHSYLPEGVESILLEIFDERAFTTDELVAWATIPIPQAVFSMETIDDWHQLSGKEGEEKEGMVNLVLSFAPLDAGPMQYVPMYQQPGVAFVQQTQTQQAAAVGPLFTEADVAELADMFPGVEAEAIRSVLHEKRGNKDAAVNALLEITQE